MAFCKDDLDSLESAIAQGAMQVKYSDRQINYRSLDDMIRTRNMMRKELGIIPSKPNRKYASVSKGLDRWNGWIDGFPFGGGWGGWW